MSKSRLNVVTPLVSGEVDANVTRFSPPVVESRAQKVMRLQAEARTLAREQLAELDKLIEDTASMAHDIAEGGDAYAVGAREVSRRLSDDLTQTLNTLRAILRKA